MSISQQLLADRFRFPTSAAAHVAPQQGRPDQSGHHRGGRCPSVSSPTCWAATLREWHGIFMGMGRRFQCASSSATAVYGTAGAVHIRLRCYAVPELWFFLCSSSNDRDLPALSPASSWPRQNDPEKPRNRMYRLSIDRHSTAKRLISHAMAMTYFV